jgi:hypothetical protein
MDYISVNNLHLTSGYVLPSVPWCSLPPLLLKGCLLPDPAAPLASSLRPSTLVGSPYRISTVYLARYVAASCGLRVQRRLADHWLQLPGRAKPHADREDQRSLSFGRFQMLDRT